MPRKCNFFALVVAAILILNYRDVIAQCPNNNIFLADLTPAHSGDTVINSCVFGGQYITTQVKAGNIYVFSTCGQNGFNTQLTLRNSTGSVWYAFNDNFCAQQSQIYWTASFTGSIRLLLDEAPGCLSNSVCQQVKVTQICQADAGTVSIFKNGISVNSPVYLCEGKDTLNVVSNNNYVLPAPDSGEIAELMYLVYNCQPTNQNPMLDTCYSGLIFNNKNFTETNPGMLSTGNRYFVVPVTVDDGDNGLNPNSMINIDNDGDSCYDLGSPIELIYLSPIAFASNLDCSNKAVNVSIFGGRPEFDSSNYVITNTGAGTIAGTPASHGSTISINNLLNGDYYSFTVSDNNGCSASFSGGPLSIPNAGNDTSIRFCASAATVNLADFINGNHDTTGQWYDPGNVLSSALFTPNFSPPGIWKYVVPGYSVCDNDTSFMYIHVDSLYEAGNNSSTTICQYDSIQNFWTKLSAAADTTGQWYLPSGLPFINPINYGQSFVSNRTYKYVVNINSSCPRDSSMHQMIMRRFPNPGLDTSLEFCRNGSTVNLTSLLPGNPHTTGTWRDPFNNIHSNIFNPAADSGGLYTYTVYGQNPCPDSSSVTTITLFDPPNPGIGQNTSFCKNDSLINLTLLLSGNPDLTGYWLNPNNDSLAGFTIDPSTALSGVYRYFVEGMGPCTSSFSTLNLSFIVPPNPGFDDTVITCSGQSPVTLFNSITGNPDAGGIWTDPLSQSFNGIFTPGISQDGVYTYTAQGNNPCPDSSSYHIVVTNTAANPGQNGTANFCTYNAPTDLFPSISGIPDSGGIWLDPLNNLFNMPFDPSVHSPGNYTYTVSGLSPCPDSSSIVSVSVQIPPDPGQNSNALFCSSDSATNLLYLLNGNPDSNGTWKDSIGNFFSGIFNPAIHTSGEYSYTVQGLSPCLDSSATILVSVFSALNPGISSSVTLCSNDSAINLINILGGNPDTLGNWKDPMGLSHSGTFNPLNGLPGLYKYEIAGIGTCSDTSSTVNVVVIIAPNPGSGDSLIVCSNDGPLDLFSLLTSGPDSNGIWYNPSNQVCNVIFNPPTDTVGIYTYKVSGTYPCSDSSSYIIIDKNQFANAGTNGSISVCESDTAFYLFSVLNGNPHMGGIWNNSQSIPFSGFFNPNTDSSGVFSYTVQGKSPCTDSTAYVTVNVVKNVNPGRDTSLLFCNNMTPVSLFSFLSNNPKPGGVWTNPSQIIFNGILDPAADSNGIYTYTVQGQAPCLDKSSLLEVDINILYSAGTNASHSICEGDPPFNFFQILGGSPDIYGTWKSPDDSSFNGMSDEIQLVNGKYVYTVNNEAPCPADSSYVDITIRIAPNAGNGENIVLCETASPVSLFSLISDNPDSNGLWYSPLNQLFSGLFDPSMHLEGRYFYVVQGNYPCADDTTAVVTTVIPLPDAGSNQSFNICKNTEINLSTLLDSTSDQDGIWLSPNKTPINAIFNGEIGKSGIYFYVSPGGQYCPGDTMQTNISVIDKFEIYAGPDIYLTVGKSKKLMASSFEAISYEWQPHKGLDNPYIVNPRVSTEEDTYYAVTGTDQYGCKYSDTLLVTVLPQLFIPNSFTPNSDGINDNWYIEGLSEYPGFTLYIYSTDNFELFKSSDPNERWDGTYKGKLMPMGNYIYTVKFEDETSFGSIMGKFSILR